MGISSNISSKSVWQWLNHIKTALWKMELDDWEKKLLWSAVYILILVSERLSYNIYLCRVCEVRWSVLSCTDSSHIVIHFYFLWRNYGSTLYKIGAISDLVVFGWILVMLRVFLPICLPLSRSLIKNFQIIALLMCWKEKFQSCSIKELSQRLKLHVNRDLSYFLFSSLIWTSPDPYGLKSWKKSWSLLVHLVLVHFSWLSLWR